MEEQNKTAVIYCRVSTVNQAEEGTSLETQEALCKDYAARNGYDVSETYIERGRSAKTDQRPELQRMRTYFQKRKGRIDALLIYKVDRLSRNNYDYGRLKFEFAKTGVRIHSVSELFEDTPDGKMKENMLSVFAQYDNDNRTERVVLGMKAAVREGRYIWQAPIGYRNVKVGGKTTVEPDPVVAPIMKKVFEILAAGSHSIDEARITALEMGLKELTGKSIPKSHFHRLIRRPLYKGEMRVFGKTTLGSFEPVVSPKVFDLAQKRIERGHKRFTDYQLDNPEFPLRRFVTSPDGTSLSGSWSRGNGGKYRYYRFVRNGGSSYSVSKLEAAFARYMDRHRLDTEGMKKLQTYVRKYIMRGIRKAEREREKMKERLVELDHMQSALIQKNLKGVLPDSAIRTELERIENERVAIQATLVNFDVNLPNMNEALDAVKHFLQKPGDTWLSADSNTRLKLQWFEFPSGVTYDGEKFRTTKLANVFNVDLGYPQDMSPMADLRFVFSNQIVENIRDLYAIFNNPRQPLDL